MKPEFLRPLLNGLLGTPSKNKELSVDLFCYIDCQSDFKRQNLALSENLANMVDAATDIATLWMEPKWN